MVEMDIRNYKFNKLIGRGVKEREREKLIQKYCNVDWDGAIDYFSGKRILRDSRSSRENKITTLSLRLANRISDELGIEVFPIIERTWAKRLLKSDGAFIWTMLRKGECGHGISDFGSGSSANECACKKNTISLYTGWGDKEVVVNDAPSATYREQR